MRVLLSTFGSRGDTEPVAALAAALQTLGAEAVVSAPPDQEFTDLVARAGVPFSPAFYSIRQWIADKAKPSAATDFSKLAAEVIAGQYGALFAAAEGCDVIVSTGLFPSTAAAHAVAETRGLRYAHASYCPLYLPSTHHAPAPWPAHPFPAGVTDNRALWEHNAETMNLLFGAPFNAFRASIGLPPVANVRDYVRGPRPLLASDPVLWPWQATDLCDAVQTGAWILPDARPLPPDLLAFLEAGSPPVFAGFGSMAMQTSPDAASAVIAAIRAHGRRAILSRGWAGLGLSDDRADCFIVSDVNHQALFPRVAAVIHHGGAGTTTSAARAGAPQIIVPQVADQPYWGAHVAALGIGVAHGGPTPTFETLTGALRLVLDPEMKVRAAAIAGSIREDGAVAAARVLMDL
jgi:vancomycin aglycone glucosyltransferase